MAEMQARRRFEGKVALITGAGSGIGRASAEALAGEGARVFCADIDGTAARKTAEGIGPAATALTLDVADESHWTRAMETILSAAGRLEILVNSAGVSAGAPLAEMSLADWKRVLSVNLDGSFLATRHALQAMASSGGSVVLVSSASGIKAAAGAAAYSASKAGVCMLARCAAKECCDRRLPIRVNTICPAGVKTPMWSSMPFFRDLVQSTGSESAAYAALSASQGGSFAEPADIVAAILFLASDDARFITGIDLLVDAGYVL